MNISKVEEILGRPIHGKEYVKFVKLLEDCYWLGYDRAVKDKDNGTALEPASGEGMAKWVQGNRCAPHCR